MKALMGMALLALAAAAPAGAATYDIAGDFGNSAFSYGTVDGLGNFSAFGTANCGDIGVTGLCYRGNDTFQVVFRANATELLAHPGPSSTTALIFSAPEAGFYTFSNILARVGDGGTTGVGVTAFLGGVGSAPRFVLTTATPQYGPFTFGFNLAQNQTVGLVLDNAGSYFNDSTLVSGSISVPEPASWAMMIGGVGLMGGALRRRRATMRMTTVRFA